jgi:hypothetical protein
MTTLNLSTGSFDQDNTFIIEVKGYSKMKRMNVSLLQGYQTEEDGIYWGLQGAVCLQNEYSAKDLEETKRLNEMTPIKHNDIVTINNEEYKVKVLGDFSDCAMFEKI